MMGRCWYWMEMNGQSARRFRGLCETEKRSPVAANVQVTDNLNNASASPGRASQRRDPWL